MPSKIEVVQGDCLEVLRGLPANSFDALVTDPPAGISFMGREWDEDKGGRTNWIWWLGCVMREVHRVLKPGAHGFVWALPRTSHWTAMALEDAGFGIRDRVVHVFGSGFPKSLDVSKGIRSRCGREAQVAWDRCGVRHKPASEAATASARQWQGWGTALKPAMEDWWLVRKTLVGTVVENVQEHGTGALNIDGARVGQVGGTAFHRLGPPAGIFGLGGRGDIRSIDAGRWPANFVLSHSADCKASAASRKASAASRKATGARKREGMFFGGREGGDAGEQFSYDGGDVDVSGCADDCPVRLLRAQGGGPQFFNTFDADPDVARYEPFFYTPKAARSEREVNLGALERSVVGSLQGGGADASHPLSKRFTKVAANVHPTVKPISLMRHLVRLVTPPGGRVFDPFGGSGTTGVACLHEGADALLIEKELQFVRIIRGRCGLI